MANRRIFSGCYAVGIAKDGSTSFTPIHGLQSVGINTSFNLEQAFEIGQINIYENIENIPDIEVTMEKLLDGYPPLYVLATQGGSSASLTGRGTASCQVAMSIFGDTVDSASGVPQKQVTMSGLFPSSVSYTIPTEGNSTESLTLVGNHKVWKSSSFDFTGTLFNNADQPLALGPPSSGGISRRENVLFTDLNGTILPAGDYGGIPGISSSGTNDKGSDGQFGAHISNISVSANLGRTPLYEIGRKTPYFRYLEFPIEVTTEISAIAIDGDGVSADETGVIPGSGNNLADKTIKIKLQEGLYIDCGTRNKLSSVTMGDAAATGGNMNNVFTYSTFNAFKVTHPQDPASLS
jgi:hypothetical protein